MAKKGSTATEAEESKEKILFKSGVTFGSGSWNKNGGSISCKIPSRNCPTNRREDLFVNTTLDVVLSTNTDPGQPPLEGMDDAHTEQRLTATVTSYSTDKTNVSVSFSFMKNDMGAIALRDLASQSGSIVIYERKWNENDKDE